VDEGTRKDVENFVEHHLEKADCLVVADAEHVVEDSHSRVTSKGPSVQARCG